MIKRNTVSYSCNLDIADAVTMLDYAVEAEKVGFSAIWASDHFHPWFHTGAKETQAWIWMSTLLDRTKSIPVGTGVTASILRYHPAIIAQAFASMEAIHGKRVFLTLGCWRSPERTSTWLRVDWSTGEEGTRDRICKDHSES